MMSARLRWAAATLLLSAFACEAKSSLAKRDEQQRIARGQPPVPERALLPDSTSALVDQLAGDRRIEVREIDDTTPYPPYEVPYLMALERQGRFPRESGISVLEIPPFVGSPDETPWPESMRTVAM